MCDEVSPCHKSGVQRNMNKNQHDMSGVVDLMRPQTTGSERKSHPIYVDLLPPCNEACPAGENIQSWLAHAQAGDYYEAWLELTKNNPFPAIHGRVCYHPCETACNRVELNSSVSIHAVERFLGDKALEENWQFQKNIPNSGKRVMVIGAGPSGLSAAYHLAMLGHTVEIFEAGPVSGGMLHFGIPAYRLPRDILQKEVDRLITLGIKINLNHKITDVLNDQKAGNFDAVYLAIGAQAGSNINIPARDSAKILDAVDVLKKAGVGEKPLLGRKVVIYGGGNTAMDSARTAKRLGADDAIIVYRRDQNHMPAHQFEVEEALEEGVKIKWLSTIKNMDGTNITIEKVVLNDEGKPVPTGEFETLSADSLILAVGQTTETDFLRSVDGVEFKKDGTVIVDTHMQTGHAGIFAGGDMVPADRTVTTAVGHGKKAAHYVNAWLRDTLYQPAAKHRVIHYQGMNLPIYSDATKSEQEELSLSNRDNFNEVIEGLTERQAQYEAKRCLSCGNCYECDNCYAACPEGAIKKLGVGLGYSVDLDKCTGCAACYEQCPCHAIDMQSEI
ncbi:NAD(P)-binding protein [Commensalibacter papalotli (ex Servin-Garciduenas et al. 2014)]